MKRGIKITLIILSIFIIIISIFVLSRFLYSKNLTKDIENIYKISQNFNESNWVDTCNQEERVFKTQCYMLAYWQLKYNNQTFSPKICQEINIKNIKLIEKILYPELKDEIIQDISATQKECFVYLQNINSSLQPSS